MPTPSNKKTKKKQGKKYFLGTPAYMSPQILFQQKYSEKCDVWSGGVLFFKLLTGKHPFFLENSPINYMELCKLYKNEPKLALLEGKKGVLKDLIKKMLEFEEKDRLSWAEVLEELKNFGFKEEEEKEEIGIDKDGRRVMMKKEEKRRKVEGRRKEMEGEIAMEEEGGEETIKEKREGGKSKRERGEREEDGGEGEWDEIRREVERGKRVGGLYKRVAKSFYELRKCEHIKLEENMNMIIFYLLLNQGYLVLKEEQAKLDHPSYFSSKFLIKSSQITNFNKFLNDLSLKNKIEINKSLAILQEIGIKIKEKLSKSCNTLNFLRNFVFLLEKELLEDWQTSQGVLKQIIKDFEEFYFKDLQNVDAKIVKVLFMLKKIAFGGDFKVLNEKLEDFEECLEGVDMKGKEELILLIRNGG